jgi:hypothetical protein
MDGTVDPVATGQGDARAGARRVLASTMSWWLLVFLLFCGYLVVALWFPLLSDSEQIDLADIYTFTPTLREGAAYAILLSALFLGTWFAYQWMRRSSHSMSGWVLGLIGLAFGLPLVFTYPIHANDIFRYFLQGRMLVHFQQNPLTTPLEALPDDRYLYLGGQWVDVTSPYGPVWELVNGLIFVLSSDDLLFGLILFKLFGLLVHLAIGALIWQLLAGAPAAERSARFVLWAWNPALLFMFVVDGHNDSLMLFWLIFGYWWVRREQPLLGITLMALAPLTKLAGLLPIPLFGLAILRPMRSWRERLIFLLLALVYSFGVMVVVFLPFGSPLPLMLRILDEAHTGASFSPLAWLIYWGGRINLTPSMEQLTRGSSALLAVGALSLAWWTWRGRAAIRSVADLYAIYLVTAFRFRIWYPTWLWPWMVLDLSGGRRLLLGFWFLWSSQLSTFIYWHLRVAWFDRDHAIAHLIGVPFVFLPLFILLAVAAVSWLHPRRRRCSADVRERA